MNINVRVISGAAQAQIKALQAQVRALQAQTMTAGAAGGGIGSAKSRKSLAAYGNQIQWTGRQLQYNWTLPLLLAGGAATKFALDNEKAFTRVQKVYGDTAGAAAFYNKKAGLAADAQYGQAKAAKVFENELSSLKDAFVALSNTYGVNQTEVLETAGAWAAAGASGVALAKSTELSLKAAILGDMELGKATESLIAIQAQYSLSTAELSLTLSELNAIENQTGISMQGLIDGFSRTAGVAREAGIDVRHLGAMMAALVPATGSAATAGNGLKTIISRLLSPTGEATKVMAEFGVDTSTAMWNSSTAMERLLVLADHMNGTMKKTGESTKSAADDGYALSDSQKQIVATTLGSRYQLNRFLVLMRELGPEYSYYEKALDATSSRQDVFAQSTKELRAVLESNPRRLAIIWTTLQNGMADAIQPMIPYIMYLAQLVATLVTKFTELDPATQKFLLFMGLALAAIGPLVRYLGSLMTLLFYLAVPIKAMAGAWVGLMTVTRLVDGENKKVRLTLIGLAGTILRMPFAYMAAGIVKLFAVMRAFPVMLGIWTATTVALYRIWTGTWALMVLTTKAAWAQMKIVSALGALAQVGILARARALMLVSWRGMWAIMVATTTAGLATIKLLFLGGLTRVGAAVAAIGGVLFSPIGLAVVAITALLWYFRDEVEQIWHNIIAYFSDSTNAGTAAIINAWNMLPAGVANALTAVARIVQQAALQIYEWFSYINPFARHSPSLVENVTNGMKVVGDQFGKARGVIGGHVKGAYQDIKRFGNAVRNITNGAANFEQAQERASIAKFAPSALGAYDRLAARLGTLKGQLIGIEASMDRQQSVVDRWTAALDRANAAIDVQQAKLDRLSDVQTKWQDALDGAQQQLDDYASAPIQGMGAMSDKIFENQMAQKALRLEIMKMGDTGDTYDDIKSKIDAIAGAQELLRGEQSRLRAGGAGSEILGEFDRQIAALEATRAEQVKSGDAVTKMNDKLAALEARGERLDLENSLKFDPLTRQIEAAANAMEELPFDKIMSGVRGAARDVAAYQQKLDQATAAVNKQQNVIDGMTAARDRLQMRLDREQDSLDAIKAKYDKVNEVIGDIESTMSGASSAADTLAQKASAAAAKAKAAADKKKDAKGAGAGYVSPAVQNFRDAKGGNFANVGGAGIPARTDFKDQSAAIDKYTQGLTDRAANAFADINPFSSIKEKWGAFKSWLSGAWDSVVAVGKDAFDKIFSDIGGGKGVEIENVITKFKVTWAKVSDWFNSNVIKPLAALWRLFWPSIQEFARNAWAGIKSIWDNVAPAVMRLIDELGQLGPAFKGLWNVIKLVIAWIAPRFILMGKIFASIAAKVIKPALEMIGNLIENFIQIVEGVVQVFSGFFSMFSGEEGAFTNGLKKMGEGIYNIFGGLFGQIGALIKGAVKIVVGFFWGIVDGIIDAAKWLWDEMVGHSIIPDLINGIIDWFKKLWAIAKWIWSNVVTPIFSIFRKLFDGVIVLVRLWWAGITTAWAVLRTVAVWLWNNVLKPIWNVVKALWTKYVGPAFKMWWTGIKFYWAVLKAVAKWLWTNVLKPIWNKVKELWSKYVGPALKAWWANVKKNWATLKAAAKWIWENVGKPVWNRIKELWAKVGPELKQWWARIQKVWNALKQAAMWVWNNVLKPVWEKVKTLWTNVKSQLAQWWGNIKAVWNSLTNLGSWVKNNVMDPVFNAIKTAWQNVKQWLTDNKDMLLGPARNIANGMIGAVNRIISGLNKVSDALPGINFHINPIQEFATGTDRLPMARRVGSGFKTNGARAIVGEGKANHPEFVIPTDPTHRNRARSLLGMAAKKLGVPQGAAGPHHREQGKIPNAGVGSSGIREYGIGGWLGDRWDDAKGLTKALSEMPANVAGKVMDPVLDSAANQVRGIGWKPVESPPLYAISKLRQWTNQTDNSAARAAREARKAMQPKGGRGVAPVPNGNGLVSWKGGTFTRQFVANMLAAERKANQGISVMQGGFRPATPYSGTSHQGDAVDLQASASLIRALRSQGIAAGDRTGLGDWGPHAHAVPGPGSGRAGGSAIWQFQDYMARGGASQSIYSPWGLKSGGIALASKGATPALLGDGRHDEAVVPLPKGWRNGLIGSTGGSSTVININGDLSLPNIKSGADAEELVESLKRMSGD